MFRLISTVFLSLPITSVFGQYSGTGSVTQGPGDTTVAAFYTCTGGRPTNLGTITATDSSVWTVPSQISFFDPTFPFSSDLYNSCVGANYTNTNAALTGLNGSDIVVVDSAGELFTAFVFADNYFEMYIDGVPVGKDRVPYTQFNSSIVRFRAMRPFTIAMLLVDWEEHLGLGYETNNTYTYYVGDGGMVMMLKDSSGNVVDITGPTWKAQTFYTAPVVNLSCAYETANERRSDTCTTVSTNNGSGAFGLHWPRPTGWMMEGYDDSSWPSAYTFSNATVGVNNKPSYTNFTDVFDDPAHDAQFIWSSNLLLDNEVLVRHTVPPASPTGLSDPTDRGPSIFPNPAGEEFYVRLQDNDLTKCKIEVTDIHGSLFFAFNGIPERIITASLCSGIYLVKIYSQTGLTTRKLFIR